jgi:hypothetical protein
MLGATKKDCYVDQLVDLREGRRPKKCTSTIGTGQLGFNLMIRFTTVYEQVRYF